MSLPPYPKYKDSGLEWLGQVPQHWEVGPSRRLFSLRNERAIESDRQLTASQKHGVILQQDFMRLEGVRVVQVITGADILKHVEPDDFVISMRSFQGGIERSTVRGSISSAYVTLVPCAEVHGPYFAYLLKSTTYIQALQTTTNLVRDGQALRYANFTQVPLPFVPLEEQTAVAAFLDRETAKIDALVAEQERLIELLKEKRQGIISDAVTKGLDLDVPMKTSGVEWLGEIPEHWGLERGRFLFRKLELPPERDDGVVTAFRDGQVTLRENRRTDGFTIAVLEGGYQRVRTGDLVLHGMDAFAGAIGVSESTGKCTPEYSVLTPLRDDVVNGYFAMVLRLMAQRDFILVICPSVRERAPRFRFEAFKDVVLPVPPLREQREILALIESASHELRSLTAEAQRAIDLLQERRTALISAAVTGQIDVRNLAGRAA